MVSIQVSFDVSPLKGKADHGSIVMHLQASSLDGDGMETVTLEYSF